MNISVARAVWVVWLAVAGVAWGQQKPHTVSLRLATHNVENFFDIFDDPYTPDEKARIKSNKSIEALGRVHRGVDADFLAVQEVENEGVLAYYRQKHLGAMGYDYIWCNAMRGTRGINLGFVSRVAVGPITTWKFQRLRVPGEAGEWTFARDLVSVEIQPAGDVRIEVFMVHLKSRIDSEGDEKSQRHRLAECLRLREIAAERLRLNPEALYAAIGDFNDTPGAGGIASVLEGGVFVDPHAGIPADRRISYLKAPYRSNIDYILLSPALAKCVVPGSARVAEADETGSDHAPVVLELALPTAEADARSRWPYPMEKRDATLYLRSSGKRGTKGK